MLALLVAVLAIAAGVPTVAGASALQDDPNASDPCSGVGNTTAVVVPGPGDGVAGPGEEIAVYNGSELPVVLCRGPGSTARLGDANRSGLTVLESEPTALRVRIVGPVDASLGALAEPTAVPGPTVTIVNSGVDLELVDGRVPVASAEQARRLRQAAVTYRERQRAYRSALDELASATARLENGSDPGGEPVAAALDARRRYVNATDAYRAVLYDVADADVGGPRVSAAIVALEEERLAIENRSATLLFEHDAALAKRERSLTWSLRLRVGGLVVLGLALGAAAGAILPLRRGRAARRQLAAGEWTAYSKWAALVPAVIGLAVLLACLAWLLSAHGDALAEVLL